MKSLLTVILSILLACSAQAATKGRILTNGKVLMHKNGRVVNTFSKQGPIDENSLIACEGSCLVKMKGLSLVATDKTIFAIKEADNAVNLYVDQGKVSFAVSDLTQQFSFYSPNDYYLSTEGFIAPASTNTSVEGFVQVTDKGTKIGMEKGTMIAQTDKGTQTIGPGQAVLLAMADVPDEQDDIDDKAAAAPCPFFSWECKTSAQKIGIIGTGTAAVLGAGLLIYLDTALDNDQIVNIRRGGDDNPFDDAPPRPASPNR